MPRIAPPTPPRVDPSEPSGPSSGEIDLFQAERAARERAEAIAGRTRRLQAVTMRLSRTLPVSEVADIVLEAGVVGLNADSGALWLLEHAGDVLRLTAQHAMPGGASERFDRVPLAERMPITYAVITRTPLWLGNRATFQELFPHSEREVRAFRPDPELALACLPLIADERMLGVFSFTFLRARGFDDSERNFLLVLADQCSQAIARMHLIERERSMRARIELLQQKTEAAYHEACMADRRKDEFLAMLGHELRNPLSPIITALELMQLRAPDALVKERATIERQARHLVRLVDDLLDVSRITRGKLDLRKRKVAVSAVIARAIELASPLLEQRRHRLDSDVPKAALHVLGDEDRLAQVVGNLLMNAAKYTEPGGRVGVLAGAEAGEVVIAVRDDGAGIDPVLLPRIFDVFTQGEQGVDRGQGGLGLGLTIARRLVELHGGTIGASSAGPGRGSEFTVRLPLLAGAPGAASDAPRPPLASDGGQPPRVLLVDDNRDAIECLGELLESTGFAVRLAFDAPDALQAAGPFAPDVVILDLGLPVMDGYELARRLRAAGSHARMIAVSGYGQDRDKLRSHEAGLAAHLVKPVDGAQLVRTVLEVLGRSSVPVRLA